jgi:ATP-dependent RNA helicase DDX10/DBP4
MNVLVCTPGRLLQHLEETYGFETINLQMLVIDEADVMLDMGFRNTLNSILQSIPRCQTLFFSATLNNEIHKLSELCMKDPERIFLHSVRQNEISSGK